MSSYVSFTAAEERDEFMKSVCSQSEAPHVIDRKDLFNAVLQLFDSEEIMRVYPLRISFRGELAIDTGGVFREMISAFWEVAYSQICDGDTLLVPLMVLMPTYS